MSIQSIGASGAYFSQGSGENLESKEGRDDIASVAQIGLGALPGYFPQMSGENEEKIGDLVGKQLKRKELTLEVLGKGNWNGAAGIVSLGASLYIVQRNALYQVNPKDGSYEQLGGDAWSGTAAMTVWRDHFYIVQKSALYQVDPKDGSYKKLGGDAWKNTTAMTVWRDHLYIVQKSALYQVDPKDGSYEQLGGDAWGNTAAMTVLGDHLYIVQRKALWKVDPKDGSYEQLGGDAWQNTTAMTVLGDHLYIVQKDHLYRTDPKTGDYTSLGDGYTGAHAHAFPDSNMIYVVQDKLKTVVIPQVCPVIAFSEADWEKYFGDVGEVPPLPPTIDKILRSPCPFWPGKRVEETHMLTLIPKSINGRPLTLNTLEYMIEKVQGGGNATTYQWYGSEVKDHFGDQGVDRSTWVLMIKDGLRFSNSDDPYYWKQIWESACALVKEQAKRAGLPYEMPHLLEAAVSILMHYTKTGERLYADTCTICPEKSRADRPPMVVGMFSSKGISIDAAGPGRFARHVGLVRKLL